MPSATFKCGAPLMVEYTPDADAAAGDVIVENDVPIIMHRPYDLGGTVDNIQTCAAFGGGVYLCTKPTGYAADWCDALYWNATTGITKTQSDYHFGRCVKPAGTNDTEILVLHDPVVGLLDES